MNKRQKAIDQIVSGGRGKHRPAYKIIKKIYVAVLKKCSLEELIKFKEEKKENILEWKKLNE